MMIDCRLCIAFPKFDCFVIFESGWRDDILCRMAGSAKYDVCMAL